MDNQSETRLANSLRKPIRGSVRRIPLRSLLIAALILVLLCGVAVAAITWGSREYLTHTDENGNQHVNEQLADLAQPISKVFEGSALRVEVVDAIFDGRSLVLTWIMRNKQTEGNLYLVMEKSQADAPWLSGQGAQHNVDSLFIHPGEMVSSGITTLFDAPVDSDTLHVAFSYAVLSPIGDVVSIGGLDGVGGTNDEYEAYRQHIDDLNAAGKLVLAPDGVIELGSSIPQNAAEIAYAELLVASGKMERIETVEVSFTVKSNVEVKNLLPDVQPIEEDNGDNVHRVVKSERSSDGSVFELPGGQPIEKNNGDYILRVTKAELSPNAAIFELERVFESRQAVERYAPFYTKKAGPHWGFSFQDEDNSWWYFNGSGGGPDAPVALPDGTWVWTYEASITELQSMPKTITIIPLRDDPETGAPSIPYPEEAIVLQVP